MVGCEAIELGPGPRGGDREAARSVSRPRTGFDLPLGLVPNRHPRVVGTRDREVRKAFADHAELCLTS